MQQSCSKTVPPRMPRWPAGFVTVNDMAPPLHQIEGSEQIDWTVSVVKNGMTLFEFDAVLCVRFWREAGVESYDFELEHVMIEALERDIDGNAHFNAPHVLELNKITLDSAVWHLCQECVKRDYEAIKTRLNEKIAEYAE